MANRTDSEKPEFVKDDGGKLRWHLFPFEAAASILEIMQLAVDSGKYPADNWKQCKDNHRYYDAILRHLVEWSKGNKMDPETGKSHLAHAGCCILFMIWLELGDE